MSEQPLPTTQPDDQPIEAGEVGEMADRWFPSSERCARYGAITDSLPPGPRVFSCACGYTADRDLNAALNLSNYPGLQGK